MALSPPARQLLVTLMLSAADAAACVLRRYNNVVSVAWNAYLSTLSHDAVLDTSQLLDLFDNAEDMLNSWVSLQTGTVQHIGMPAPGAHLGNPAPPSAWVKPCEVTMEAPLPEGLGTPWDSNHSIIECGMLGVSADPPSAGGRVRVA